MKNMNIYYFIVLFCIIDVTISSDVLGCGGFIKSHAAIDFSKIEVKLYTKQGTLKDSTFCAPNNGYYFLPLYDKGEYFLRINPPTGWSFVPKEVLLKVDGVTDLCSQSKDINFIFEGFGITGQVDNIGGGPGPKGVKITLTRQNEVRETVTNDEGSFFFTPVYPGTYILTASHPKWNFKENKHTVQVASENKELPKNTFLVTGYDVTGSVIFERQQMSNIYFILFNESNKPVLFEKCSKEKLPGFTNEKNYLCYVKSNEHGQFVFPQLSPGSYKVVPFYEAGNMKYHFQPEFIKFEVTRNSLVLPQTFEVQSFSFSGRVLTHKNGQTIEGATVFVNDKPVTTTQTDGSFKLHKVSAGTYNIHIESPGLKFEKKTVKIIPSVDLQTDIFPSEFQVCGTVTSEDSNIIVFKTIDKGSDEYKVETIKGNGEYCRHVPPGKYSVRVDSGISNIQFFPVSQTITVVNAPISDVNFSQLKATVKGRVKCLMPADCAKISVIMKQVSSGGNSKEIVYKTNLVDGHYTFHDVVTSTYKVSLGANKYCWQGSHFQFVVNSETTIVPDFVQIGYNIVFFSSHDAQLLYQSVNKATTDDKKLIQKEIKLSPGQNTHCVEHPGYYEFEINSCHQYKNSIIKHNTNDDTSEIVLTALKHQTSIEITSTEQIPDLTVNFTIAGITTKRGTIIGVLKDRLYHYTISLHLSEGEEAIVTPSAEQLWFKPTSVRIVGESDCVNLGPKIVGLKGKVIQGKVVPTLAGVKITVEGPGGKILVRETDSDGTYKFPTLDDSHTYKITAEKNTYTFTGPDNNGIFKAHKLAEIIVTAVDEKDGSPLQGALISLSGGESYRSNLQTNADGVINFSSLNPSDYFLRPMMKEYNFEPSSKIISIAEGATVNVKLKGHRVAYSAYGSVNSLSGEPDDKIVVVADGRDHCAQYSEEATTEENGQFRLRGLHPKCKYEIKIKESLDPNQKIERAVPESTLIQTENEDIKDIKLVALRYIQYMDIVVQVITPKPEYFKSLRLKLCKESNQNSPIFNVRLDTLIQKSTSSINQGLLVHLPPLPIENKSYFLQLESSLSQAVHNYKTVIEYFSANTSFKYFILEFNPQSQILDQDIGHTSVLALPFILLCMIGMYNIQQISKIVSDLLGKYNLNIFSNAFVNGKSSSADRVVDNDEIDQIVQNINAVKRRVRPKKI